MQGRWGLFCPFHFLLFFSAIKQACGPEARALNAKSIGPGISDCGLRISDFLGFLFQSAFRNRHSAIWRRAYRAPQIRNVEFGILTSFFHSAIRIPHLNCPPDPKNETCLMVFAFNALASGPGKT
jgi:hypothetical protein